MPRWSDRPCATEIRCRPPAWLHRSPGLKHQKLRTFVANGEAGRLRGPQAPAGRLEDRLNGILGVPVSGDRTSIFDSQYQDSAFGVGERGDVPGDLVTDLPAIPRLFPAVSSIEKRLPFEVLPLVLQQEGGDVE